MTKREQYDEVVSQVEADLPLIKAQYPTSYEEAVNADSLIIGINGEDVKVDNFPIGVFSDYAVRDSLMVRAISDERFGLILTCKVGKYAETKINNGSLLSQDDVEAIITSAQITTMWEQFDTSEYLLGLIAEHSEDSISIPALAGITMGCLSHRKEIDFAKMRADMSKDLLAKSVEALDNE